MSIDILILIVYILGVAVCFVYVIQWDNCTLIDPTDHVFEQILCSAMALFMAATWPIIGAGLIVGLPIWGLVKLIQKCRIDE
jgi:hypothetical protein